MVASLAGHLDAKRVESMAAHWVLPKAEKSANKWVSYLVALMAAQKAGRLVGKKEQNSVDWMDSTMAAKWVLQTAAL